MKKPSVMSASSKHAPILHPNTAFMRSANTLYKSWSDRAVHSHQPQAIQMHTYNGRCQCGQSEIRIITPFAIVEEDLRACGCDFCVKHGGTYFSAPDSRATISTKAEVTERHQGSNTASMLFCSNCRDFLGVSLNVGEKLIGAVCAQRFEVLAAMRPRVVANSAEMSRSRKIARWKSLWMPLNVTTSV